MLLLNIIEISLLPVIAIAIAVSAFGMMRGNRLMMTIGFIINAVALLAFITLHFGTLLTYEATSENTGESNTYPIQKYYADVTDDEIKYTVTFNDQTVELKETQSVEDMNESPVTIIYDAKNEIEVDSVHIEELAFGIKIAERDDVAYTLHIINQGELSK